MTHAAINKRGGGGESGGGDRRTLYQTEGRHSRDVREGLTSLVTVTCDSGKWPSGSRAAILCGT